MTLLRHWHQCRSIPLLLLLLLPIFIHAFSFEPKVPIQPKPTVLVVGKIIMDDYRKPDQPQGDGRLSVGGGGPQAAVAASLALATLYKDTSLEPQPVLFSGPVGGLDWNDQDQQALEELLAPSVEQIIVDKSPDHQTPRIQLWHDNDQNIQWRALEGSFDDIGANGLWQNRPSVKVIEELLAASTTRKQEQSSTLICHAIIEGGGESGTGKGLDASFLWDNDLRDKIDVLGIEPIVFCDEATGTVRSEDAQVCTDRILKLDKVDILSPDKDLDEQLDYVRLSNIATIGVRNGPKGSLLKIPRYQDDRDTSIPDRISIPVPCASLVTPDVVNPTGAGNAYSAALTTCLGSGAGLIESTCIATAIGAAFVEVEHVPEYSLATLGRIRDGVEDVKRQLRQ